MQGWEECSMTLYIEDMMLNTARIKHEDKPTPSGQKRLPKILGALLQTIESVQLS